MLDDREVSEEVFLASDHKTSAPNWRKHWTQDSLSAEIVREIRDARAQREELDDL